MPIREQHSADRLDALVPLDQLAVLVAANEHVVAVGIVVQQFRALVGGALHHDDTAHVLPALVGLMHEAIDEGPQESARAELQDGFRESVHYALLECSPHAPREEKTSRGA